MTGQVLFMKFMLTLALREIAEGRMRSNLVAFVAGSFAMVLAFAGTSHAAPQYTNDFEVDSSASWTTNKGPATTDEAHSFFFDYSTAGIPLAPNSAAGGTRGMKLQANQS